MVLPRLIGLSLLAALCLSSPAAIAQEQRECGFGGDFQIAAEDGFFPYTGLYNGELRGFSLDIVAAAFRAVGCRVGFIVMPYNRCIREVQIGRQFGCFNTTNSLENQKKYIFHKSPLFRGKILVYAHPDFERSFSEMDFRTGSFAVVRGYTYTDAFDLDPTIAKIQVESDLQTLELVARGRADFAVVYERVAQFHIGNNARLINPPPEAVSDLVEFDLFVSFSRKTLEKSELLAELLDDGLAEIRANGTYAEIERAWAEWLASGVAEGKPAPHQR